MTTAEAQYVLNHREDYSLEMYLLALQIIDPK